MVKTEAPASCESRRQQLLPSPSTLARLSSTLRAPWKGAVSQRVRIPPGNCRSSRKQSERCREVTNCTEALR